MNINIAQITSELDKLPLDEVGKSSKFFAHEGKLTALSFLLGFFDSFFGQDSPSQNSWSQSISFLLGQVFTRQALCQRLGYRCYDFCLGVFKIVMRQRVAACLPSHDVAWLQRFQHVYIEDSTCLALPSILFDTFGGCRNKQGAYTLGRLQVRVNLKNDNLHHLELTPYGRNDRSYAAEILTGLVQNDLIIRDLGYFYPKVWEKIAQIGAYFLSRWDNKTPLWCQITPHEPLCLSEMLNQLDRQGTTQWEGAAVLGTKNPFKCRLILSKLPPEQAAERIEKAKAVAKDKQKKRSEAYYEWLKWSILLTNLPQEEFGWQQIFQIYALRWRIEMIFKAWESHLNFEKILTHPMMLKPTVPLIYLYLSLIWITLFLVPAYNYWTTKAINQTNTPISLGKFVKWFAKNYQKCVKELDEKTMLEFVVAHCAYEKRTKNDNYFKKMYIINSS